MSMMIGNFVVDQYNYVAEGHITKKLAELNLGWFLGKVSLSSTCTKSSEAYKTIYSYTNEGNDGISNGIGVNFWGWLGLDAGFNTNWNIYVNAQVTPWLHGGVSLGWEGLGGSLGLDMPTDVDNERLSGDLSVTAGIGTLLALFIPELAVGAVPALAYN